MKNSVQMFVLLLLLAGATAIGGQKYSVASGNWGTAATWATTRGGTGGAATPVSGDTVVITAPTMVTVDASGKTCYTLIVDSGAALIGNVRNPNSAQVYVRVSGDTVLNNGVIGYDPSKGKDSTTAICFEMYTAGKSVTFTGNGDSRISRIRNGSNLSNTTTIIDQDVTLTYQGSSGTGGDGWYGNNGTGVNTGLKVNAGHTLNLVDQCNIGTTSSTDVDGPTTTIQVDGSLLMKGANGTMHLRGAAGAVVSLIVNGTVEVGRSLKPSGTTGVPSTITVNTGGVLKVGTAGPGTVYFNAPTQTVTGAGSFQFAGGTMQIGAAAGLDPVNGPIRTTTRTFATTAGYAYLSNAAQATGSDLPAHVGFLSVADTNAALTLMNNLAVDSALTLNVGTLVPGSKTLTVGGLASTNAPGAFVNGSMIVPVSVAGQKTWTVGEGADALPLSAYFHSVTGSDNVTAAAVNRSVTAPAGGLTGLTKVLNRYYHVTKGAALTALTADSLTLSYTHADVAAAGTVQDSLRAFMYTGSAWTPLAIVRRDTALNILVTAPVTTLADILITGADKTAGPTAAFPENFDYPAGDSLTYHNWQISSGGTLNAVLTTSPGLTFPNYPLSGVGNAATLTTTGQDVYKAFPKDSGGSFYSTFMLKVTAAQATGDYFYALSPAESQTGYTGRLWIKSSGAGFQFGISKSNETAIYGTKVFDFNTTYLTVVKYTFDPAKDSNDVIKVYALAPGTALTAEPNVPEIADTAVSRADAKNFAFVTLRQGGATAAPSLVIDGMRVEKSWYTAMGVPTLDNFYSVGTGSVSGERANFPTMKAALDSLSHGMPIPSNTTFYITSDITEPETGGKGIGLAVDPSPYTVTFKPAAGVKPTITLQYPSDGNSGPSGAFVIGMNSAAMAWADLKTTRNIIFDGSNQEGGKSRDLTIQTTGVTRNAIPMAIVGDVQNITIKNCNVLYKVVPTAASTSSNLLGYALLIRSATAGNTGTVEKIPSNITIDNNWLSTNYSGVTTSFGGVGGYSAGAISTYPSGIVITNNKIEGVRHGVALYYLGATTVSNNEIIANEGVSSVSAEGVYAVNTLGTATYTISNNKITKLAVRDSSVLAGGIAGISIEGRGTFNIYNNMISGFALTGVSTNKNAYLYGIRVADSAVTNISYNTIRMDSLAPAGTGTINYRGLYFANGINTVKNNIVANFEDDFASVNIYRGNNGTVGTLLGTLTSDYNDFYRASNANAVTGFKDTSKATTMTAWRSASGVDANSIIGAPGFVSASDLHIDVKAAVTPLISNAGTPIAGITTDIDGDLRSATTPDIGADEFTMVQVAPPIPVVTIAEARKDANNDFIADHSITRDTLKIYGVVVSPNYGASYPQLSNFIQDATGGMDIFGYTLPTPALAIGDSIYVVGTVAQYKGLVEFTPGGIDTAHFGVIKKNAVVPAPKRLTLRQFVQNAESYEGQLVEVDTLYKATGTWPVAAANTSIYVTNIAKTDTAQMFLDLDMNIFGPKDPVYPINLVGIVSQYSTATVPNNGYEIMPRGMSDITPITVLGVEGLTNGLPTTYELMNNYPNPFNPTTVIKFALPKQSAARLIVYDMLGREVRTLVNGTLGAGYFETQWNGKNNNGAQVASGMYIYRIEAGSFVSSKKMMLLK